MNTTRQSTWSKILLWTPRIVIGALVVVGVVSIARVGHAYWIHAKMQGWLVTNLGLDAAVAMLGAVIGTTALIMVLPAVIWFIFTGRRKKEVAGIAIASSAMVALLVNTVGRDICFDRGSGRPLCYVAETPVGLVFSRTPGVDPRFGVPFQVYTAEMAQQRARDSLQQLVPPRPIVPRQPRPTPPTSAEPSSPPAAQPPTTTQTRPYTQPTSGGTERQFVGAEATGPSTVDLVEAELLANPETHWQPEGIWRSVLRGKRVRLIFRAEEVNSAARVAGRLRTMGATVEFLPIQQEAPRYPRSVAYPFEDLDAAQAVQNALHDLFVLDLEGTGRQGSLTITLSR